MNGGHSCVVFDRSPQAVGELVKDKASGAARAWRILWLVTGSEKVGMLARLRKGDASIPAGRIRQDRALLFADRAAVPDLAVEGVQKNS